MGRLLCVILMLVGSSMGSAQDLEYDLVTSRDGLSSNVVYHTLQDQHGYIWFATNSGISRFDGYEWDYFSKDEGLSAVEVYRMYEDPKGRIWFLGANGRLSYYHEGEIVTHTSETALDSLSFGSFLYGVASVDGELWVSCQNGEVGQYVNGQMGKKHHLEGNGVAGPVLNLDGTPTVINTFGVEQFSTEEGQFKRVADLELTGFPRASLTTSLLVVGVKDQVLILEKDEFDNHTSFSLPEDHLINEVTTIKDRVWCSTNKGILVYSLNGELISQHLVEYNVTSVMMDHEGGLWATTSGNGVIYARVPGTLVYDRHERFIRFDRNQLTGEISVGGENGRYYTLNGNKLQRHQITYPNLLGTILHIRNHANSTWIFGRGGLVRFSDTTETYIKLPCRHVQFRDSLLYYCRYSGLYQVNISQVIEHEMTGEQASQNPRMPQVFVDNLVYEADVHCFLIEDNNKYWIGTANELIAVHNGRAQDVVTGCRITDIENIDGNIWVSTHGQGLYIIRNGQVIKHFTKSSGLTTSYLSAVRRVSSTTVVVANSNGITIVQHDNLRDWTVRSIDHTNGLSGEDVIDIMPSEEDPTLWLSTDAGLVSFNLFSLNQSFPANILIKEARIEGKPINISDVIETDYNSNSLQFRLAGFVYKNKPRFKYRIKGLSSDWVVVDVPQIDLLDINPGEYELEIYALAENGAQSDAPVKVKIIVHPPFWQTLWFKLLVALAIVLVVYLFFRIRVLSYNRDVVRELLLSMARKTRKNKTVLVKNVKDGSMAKVELTRIRLVRGARDYVILEIADGPDVMVKSTMKNMHAKLNDVEPDFYRIHQSFIVNFRHVTSVHGTFVKVAEENVPVGRAFKETARRLVERFN